MTAAVYVLTCARPVEDESDDAWPYVFKTCDAIDAEEVGFDHTGGPRTVPHVLFVDGAAPPRPPGGPGKEWDVVEWERPHMALRGNKLPYFALLEHALDAGHEDVVVFEDDLIFTANAVRRMTTYPVPADVALVQFFAPHILPVAHMQPGLWRAPTTSFEFCQAVKFPRRTLRALFEWTQTREFGKYVESDQALNLALQRLQLRYGVHCPDLVQHIGENSATVPGSSVRETSGRIAQCFPDPGFDALRLYDLDVRYR